MAYTVNLYYPEATSGTYELTQPNSATRVVAYQDYLALTEISSGSQGLSSIGRARFYLTEVAEVVVKDSRGVEVARFVEGSRAELVEVVNDGFTGTLPDNTQGAGGRTDLDTVLSSAHASFGGADFQYQPVAGANPRPVSEVLAERMVSVFDVVGPNGEIAVGDGTADDTAALQQWIDLIAAAGGGIGILPAGTYANTGITITSPNIILMGQGPGVSVLLNTGGASTCITVNVAGNADLSLRNFGIDHVSASTAAGIDVTDGDNVNCHDIIIDKHRQGFEMGSGNFDNRLYRCIVTDTDGNALSEGIVLGRDGRAEDCVATATTGTAYRFRGADAHARGCIALSSAIGFHFVTANCIAFRCRADSNTTGFEDSGQVHSGPIECRVSGNTTDFVTAATTAEVIDYGNDFGSITLGEAGGTWGLRNRGLVRQQSRQTMAATTTLTPDLTKGPLQVMVSTAAAPSTLTIGATSTVGLIDGQEFFLVIANNDDINSLTLTFNAQYVGISGSPLSANAVTFIQFTWRASNSDWFGLLGEFSIPHTGDDW